MAFAGGDGSINNPYQIKTAEQLNEVRGFTGNHFIQVSDIDLSGYPNWAPLGAQGDDFTVFYDGGGFRIRNMSITVDGDYYGLGLFGYVSGEIRRVENMNLSITASDTACVGGIAGWFRGIMEDCYASGHINGFNAEGVGGLIGNLVNGDGSVVRRCQGAVNLLLGHISGDEDTIYCAGGLIGEAGFSLVWGTDPNSFPNPEVGEKVNDKAVTYVYQCSSSGDVLSSNPNSLKSEKAESFGGLVGKAYSVVIDSCHSSSHVRGYSRVGGLIGECRYSIIRNCYSTGTVEYDFSYGSYDTWDVTVGGLIGANKGNFKVVNCYTSSRVTESNIVHQEDGTFSIGAFYGTEVYAGYTSDDIVAMESCYYNSDITSLTDYRALPRSESDLKKQGTYTGWDFEDVWDMDSDINNGLPYLRGMVNYALPLRVGKYNRIRILKVIGG